VVSCTSGWRRHHLLPGVEIYPMSGVATGLVRNCANPPQRAVCPVQSATKNTFRFQPVVVTASMTADPKVTPSGRAGKMPQRPALAQSMRGRAND
jgi:hypothetical protein